MSFLSTPEFVERRRQAYADREAAIRGESIPSRLRNILDIHCLIRGIRYHDGFAEELRERSEVAPQVIRALNARAIMSNRIPEINTSSPNFPYCFWHPDIPSEQTLRQLLKKYPQNSLLPYQVGRSCAAGGYTELYHELNLLPEVAIAEEARDNNQSGHAIYQAIMNAPVRYSYMDDYNCCLREHPISPAYLNGDTCVRSVLDKRRPMSPGAIRWDSPQDFDITEDNCVDIGPNVAVSEDRPVDPEAVQLLSNPLPLDLPTVDKNLLILMAAWTGNIDRYARLRRPKMVNAELQCIIRGIHHHPFFGKWWLSQPDGMANTVICQAVYARCIMSNDLSWLNDTIPESQLPELIWFPQVADELTYRELTRRRPSMAPVAARACMHASYTKAFDEINWEPEMWLWSEARRNHDTYYLESIERKAHELGFICEKRFPRELEEKCDWWERDVMAVLRQEWYENPDGPHPRFTDGSQSMSLPGTITTKHLGFVNPEVSRISSMVGQVLLHASVADQSIRPAATDETLDLSKLYEELLNQ